VKVLIKGLNRSSGKAYVKS